MGYDVNRFQGEVDEELTCPICSGVLEDPLQVRQQQQISEPHITVLKSLHYIYRRRSCASMPSVGAASTSG